MNEKLISVGMRLVNDIRNMTITKDTRPNKGKDFHGGFEKLYLYKFKKYNSSVGKYIRDLQLKEDAYNG